DFAIEEGNNRRPRPRLMPGGSTISYCSESVEAKSDRNGHSRTGVSRFSRCRGVLRQLRATPAAPDPIEGILI
ncbi:MAG: hypothetical protein AB7G28_03085, partial [Pirellulales bacterium]